MSTSIIRNSALNFIAQSVILLVTFIAMPLIVGKLSEEKFGLLTIVWSFVGYFALLDFGISRASAKFIAGSLVQKNQKQIDVIIWISLITSLCIGVIGTLAIIILTPFFVNDVFRIGTPLVPIAKQAFIISACGIPFMLLFGTTRGFQIAYRRFDMANYFQMIIGIVQWGGAVILLYIGRGFIEVIWLTVGIRILCSIVSVVMIPAYNPGIFKQQIFWKKEKFNQLVSFGGWLTISQIISPMFLYLDRLMIGGLSTLSAVAYYSIPQEAMTRVLIIPMSLTTILFPTMSELSVNQGQDEKSERLYFKSLKYIFFLMLLLVFVFVVFAEPLLYIWMGPEFAKQSATVFQILSIGMFFNVLAQLPATVLHAYGRPDLTAKFHGIELALIIGMNIILIPSLGIVGAAISWSIRLLLDLVFLLFAAHRYVGKTMHSVKNYINLKNIGLQIGLVCFLIIIVLYIQNSSAKLMISAVLLPIVVAEFWFFGLDNDDRLLLKSLPNKLL